MKQVNFGMIGTGGISESQHLPNILRAPNIHLSAACDLRQEQLDKFQKKYDIPRVTLDYKKLMRDKSIEALFVTTREDMQAKLTIEALKAGKHVYVEKPLAATSDECKEVVKAQKKSGKYVAVGHNRRFAPAYNKAKEIIDADGGAKSITYRVADNYHYGWGKHYGERQRLLHEVCHVFDILRYFTGSEVESIYCIESRPDEEIISLKFKNGSTAVIFDTGYTSLDFPKERMEITTHYGAVTVDDYVELRTFGYKNYEPVYRFAGHTHPDKEYTYKNLYKLVGMDAHYALKRTQWELWFGADKVDEIKDPFERAEMAYYKKYHMHKLPMINYQVDKGWVRCINEFAGAILKGVKPLNASATDAYRASVLCHAAMKSRATGKIVKVINEV